MYIHPQAPHASFPLHQVLPTDLEYLYLTFCYFLTFRNRRVYHINPDSLSKFRNLIYLFIICPVILNHLISPAFFQFLMTMQTFAIRFRCLPMNTFTLLICILKTHLIIPYHLNPCNTILICSSKRYFTSQ